MVDAKKAVTQYNQDINAYVSCIKLEHEAAVTKVGGNPTAEQKTDMARAEQVEVQKNNAAVDQLQSIADRFNEQVRIYKAKNDPATAAAPAVEVKKKSWRASPPVLTPAQAEELIGQHLQCLPIESLPLAQCAGAVLRENIYAERDAPPFDRVSMDGIAARQ